MLDILQHPVLAITARLICALTSILVGIILLRQAAAPHVSTNETRPDPIAQNLADALLYALGAICCLAALCTIGTAF